MRTCALVMAMVLAPAAALQAGNMRAAPPTAPLPRLQVHAGGHYLQTSDGRPFLWIGDTAWNLIGLTTPQECSFYLRTRARQGFTVIQSSILFEDGAVKSPSVHGQTAFLNEDPARPNDAFFDRVVAVVDEAASHGLYVALLPTWGDKLTAPWGTGPRIFRLDNLPVVRAYGQYLGRRLRDRTNVIWMLGGDRPARVTGLDRQWPNDAATAAGFPAGMDWTPIWRAMVDGLQEGLGSRPLTIYHPQGGAYTASQQLAEAPWLDMFGMQGGHGGGHDAPVWEWIARDVARTPPKPTIELEPNYEDHPFNPWPRWDPATGYFRDHDVRKQAYRAVLAGGAGVSYGHHAVWQFASARTGVINFPDRDWVSALDRPGARQMVHLRSLLESRPFFSRIPDTLLVVRAPDVRKLHVTASRDRDGSYALLYFPENDLSVEIDLTRLRGSQLQVWWYDPRSGFAVADSVISGNARRVFTSPAYGPDWVLVLDDVAARYPPPGAPMR